MVDGDGEGRLVVIGVGAHHLGDVQPLHVFLRHGHTDQPLAVGGHKVDVLRGGELGGADEIPFVFPVRVVCHQDDFSLAQIVQSFLDCVECCHGLTS